MLSAHSKYSLRFGIHSPEEITEFFQLAGYQHAVLTDINTTTGCLSFISTAQQLQLIPVVGCDVRNNFKKCYLILAQSNLGFCTLNDFISHYIHTQLPFPERCPELDDCLVIYPIASAPMQLQKHEFVGVCRSDLNRLAFHSAFPKNKLVIGDTMTFMGFNAKEHQRYFNTHRLLRAIDRNCLLSQLSPTDFTAKENVFLTWGEIKTIYRDFQHIINNTLHLLACCSIKFSFGDHAEVQNIANYTGSKTKDFSLLKKLAYEGLNQRYPIVQSNVVERIEKELSIIAQKNYLSYFLVTWDILQYAQKRNFFHVGRGSGANSIVAYLLGITDVDPIELDLYFERFINLHRKNPPDFDIDFSWKDRDHVVDYIMNRFENTALLCTYNTFQFRAAIREIGKVLGLPAHEIDKLAEGKKPSADLDKLGDLVIKYSRLIDGLPSYLSVHSGGIVISEKPIHWFGATFLPPKGFPTTQFSMLEAEDIGLYKYDILSQRGLSKIHECIEIVRKNQPAAPIQNIRNVAFFKQDDKIRELLMTGNAIGCFYVESTAMRMLMIKLEVKSYLELVAASSIIRPGVSSSGMMREYILRHKNPERRKTAHPVLLSIMPETYGVMVYQEDVIKVAHFFAGLTLDEADVLRRGMSGKFRSREEFQAIKAKFYANCIEKGYGEATTSEIWRQIESFAGYAFSKGHSASYAVESYQSLYLKAYFPLEYMVATINNGGGYYRREIYIQEARRLGALILAPEINKSNWETVIEGKTIYLGFSLIKGMESKVTQLLIKERRLNGDFQHFDDLNNRISIPTEQLDLLIRIGAFRNLHQQRKALFWRNHMKAQSTHQHLFTIEIKHHQLPELEDDPFEQTFEEMELLEFPLCNPFELSTEIFGEHQCAKDIPSMVGKSVKLYGYLMSLKRTPTKNNDRMYFGNFYDQMGDLFDTVHFPDSARKFPFRGIGIYEVRGTVSEEFGHFTVEVFFLRKINYIPDVRYEENKKAAS